MLGKKKLAYRQITQPASEMRVPQLSYFMQQFGKRCKNEFMANGTFSQASFLELEINQVQNCKVNWGVKINQYVLHICGKYYGKKGLISDKQNFKFSVHCSKTKIELTQALYFCIMPNIWRRDHPSKLTPSSTFPFQLFFLPGVKKESKLSQLPSTIQVIKISRFLF